ncbi:TPA: hypothetical protein ACPJ0C_004713 [Vibrio alginolyticus]
MIECSMCNETARYVLVDYTHDIVDRDEVYCPNHAFQDGREECPCCYDYTIEYEDDDGNEHLLLPTYPEGELDREGCCSEHP